MMLLTCGPVHVRPGVGCGLGLLPPRRGGRDRGRHHPASPRVVPGAAALALGSLRAGPCRGCTSGAAVLPKPAPPSHESGSAPLQMGHGRILQPGWVRRGQSCDSPHGPAAPRGCRCPPSLPPSHHSSGPAPMCPWEDAAALAQPQAPGACITLGVPAPWLGGSDPGSQEGYSAVFQGQLPCSQLLTELWGCTVGLVLMHRPRCCHLQKKPQAHTRAPPAHAALCVQNPPPRGPSSSSPQERRQPWLQIVYCK